MSAFGLYSQVTCFESKQCSTPASPERKVVMRVKLALVLLTAIFVGGFAPTSSAVQQQKLYGVMDDNPIIQGAAQAGFTAVKQTVRFSPTQWHWESLDSKTRDQLTWNMADAQSKGVAIILEMYPVIKYGPPRGPSQMRNTCMLAKDLLDRFPETFGIEIGVEPNSYTFWKPQFNPDGTQASAAAYETWLAKCYDVLKAQHPDVKVIGGSLSSRGEDDPHKPTSGTSPALFLTKFCEAYKASGRSLPVMDWLDMHSYPDPENQDPAVQHPAPSTTITIADYAKLDALLGCFSGTAQPKPPILWGETGYNTVVPDSKAATYQGQKPPSIRLVDEATQGRYAAEQIQMTYCQPDTVGWFNFHFVDDPSLTKDWQSGFAYAPRRNQRSTSGAIVSYTLKQSLPPVSKALEAVKNGTMKC